MHGTEMFLKYRLGKMLEFFRKKKKNVAQGHFEKLWIFMKYFYGFSDKKYCGYKNFWDLKNGHGPLVKNRDF